MMDRPTIDEVRRFWDANPCGSGTSSQADRRRYFEEVARERYTLEPHVPVVARFDDFAGRDVLEIGCGIGTDGLRFARAGARYVGVDLSPRSVALAKEHFELFGARGRIEVANAEDLPFPDETFDHVYSHGVIHHSPYPERVVEEIRRVVRPGGTFSVMVYNRTSINYLIEIMAIRRALRWLLVMPGVAQFLALLIGLEESKLRRHGERLRELGRPTRAGWLSANTDGPDCPLARVYSRNEALALFPGFEDIATEVRFFNRLHWGFLGRLLPGRVCEYLGRYLGWHRVVRGRKAES